MPFASDEEIKTAHEILLKGKPSFDEQRIDIIKDDSSCFVQACPGSGKTTILLAKLIILANRMPLPEGKGICVLTHTNVAIDEIKAKLGQKADVLFNYPNFFGTIQTFLHKYVTAAALHYFYGSQLTYVDDDIAKAVLIKKYNSLKWDNQLKKYVFASISNKEHVINDEEIETWGGVDLLREAKVIKKKKGRSGKYLFQLKNYNLTGIPSRIHKQIYEMKKNILAIQSLEIIISTKADWLNSLIKIDNKTIGITTPTAKEYISIKESMYKEGILSFDDAYDLAFRYIHEKGLDFSAFSDKRFQYLFIDEVQDCAKQQVELITKIFDKNKIVIQRFGDYCQAIFSREEEDETLNNDLNQEIRYIHNSHRFGEKIAKPLRTICMEDNHLLVGNADIASVKPIIITYEDPLTVLPKYVELLRTITIPEMENMSVLEIAKRARNQDPLNRINVKACGWVGKHGATQQKRYIESYFPLFEKNSQKPKMESESFNDFITSNSAKTAKDLVSSFIQGILKFLDLCNVKNENRRYNRKSFLDFLSNKDIEKKTEFLNNVVDWVKKSMTADSEEDVQSIKDIIYQYMKETLLPLFSKVANENANTFFYSQVSPKPETFYNKVGNIYHDDANNIDIEVETVHAVKGETHISTLYLETSYFRKHDSIRLSEQFKGNPYTGTDENILKNLKVAYVAMSRPRYLLCVALQKDRFDQINSPELKQIWDIVKA